MTVSQIWAWNGLVYIVGTTKVETFQTSFEIVHIFAVANPAFPLTRDSGITAQHKKKTFLKVS